MTDRELLELAAKAAGMGYEPFSPKNGYDWNPLNDDGDALRLAVKLGMALVLKGSQAMHPHVTVEIDLHYTSYTNAAFEEQPDDGDPYAATRRAIVRAAAAIGASL